MDDAVEKMQGAIRNWGRWSDIVVVMLPNILFVVIRLEQIVSISFGIIYFCWLYNMRQENLGRKRVKEFISR